MKRFILFLVITCFWVMPASAAIRTRNVDFNDEGFQYKVPYQFATEDVGENVTETAIPAAAAVRNTPADQYYYAVPYKGNIIGIAIASNTAITAYSVTADVTINGCVTGVRTTLNSGQTAKISSSGEVASHSQSNCNTLDLISGVPDESPPNWGGGAYDSYHPYGRATPLVAGDRIGVKITTDNGMRPTSADINVTVFILQ